MRRVIHVSRADDTTATTSMTTPAIAPTYVSRVSTGSGRAERSSSRIRFTARSENVVQTRWKVSQEQQSERPPLFGA
jgi:hypothetical protein